MRAKPYIVWAILAALLALSVAGCGRLANLRRSLEGEKPPAARTATTPVTLAKTAPALEEVATSEAMWTGVAFSKAGRCFVGFPRWTEDPPTSVGEIRAGGSIHPYPDPDWNTWSVPEDPAKHFVCVQSVYVDADDDLWVLDPANAYLRGVVSGGAKLVRVDLKKNAVAQVISFDQTVAPPASYLNDVRVDTEHRVAYITDSGLGALVVVDLATGAARRVLAGSSTTKSENVVLKINGREWRPGGQAPRINVDGLALDPAGKYLYYHALTARNLYRIETRYLRDPGLSDQALEARVESMGETGAADGIEFGANGYLYLTGIEEGAIKVFVSLGQSRTVVKDKQLVWPDSFARGGEYMYVTSSQINLSPEESGPYRLFRFKTGK
jgi:sugar lactone lactonase YvrE